MLDSLSSCRYTDMNQRALFTYCYVLHGNGHATKVLRLAVQHVLAPNKCLADAAARTIHAVLACGCRGAVYS